MGISPGNSTIKAFRSQMLKIGRNLWLLIVSVMIYIYNTKWWGVITAKGNTWQGAFQKNSNLLKGREGKAFCVCKETIYFKKSIKI